MNRHTTTLRLELSMRFYQVCQPRVTLSARYYFRLAVLTVYTSCHVAVGRESKTTMPDIYVVTLSPFPIYIMLSCRRYISQIDRLCLVGRRFIDGAYHVHDKAFHLPCDLLQPPSL